MHPLFPTEGEQSDDERDISWIQVTRWEGGAYKFAPQLVAAEDLQGLEELHQLFGGGQYELIARIADKSRISTRKKYNLPGAPKPLAPSNGDEPGASSATTAQHAQGAAIVGSADSPMMALLAMMMQQSQQQAAMMTQVIVAALGQRNTPAPDHTGPVVKALTEMATRAQATGQAPQGSMDAILRAMEIGRSLGKGEGEGDESSLMASLAQLLHGAMAAQQSGPPTNGAPPS